MKYIDCLWDHSRREVLTITQRKENDRHHILWVGGSHRLDKSLHDICINEPIVINVQALETRRQGFLTTKDNNAMTYLSIPLSPSQSSDIIRIIRSVDKAEDQIEKEKETNQNIGKEQEIKVKRGTAEIG